MDCDLYRADKILLTCTVTSEGVSDSALSLEPSNNLRIRWFFNNGTDRELTTGTNETRREGGNGEHVVISSILAISGSESPPENVASLAVGSYYCQVQVNDETMQANSSQQFKALDPDEYLQSATSCTERNFIAGDSACAVHNIPTTTSPNPSAVDSDSTSSVQEDTTSKSTLSDGNKSTEPAQPSPGGGGTTLEVWIYVLVAVAAVFAMIIIILAIMCVGLCLRRSQTMDANYSKLPSSLVHNRDASSCVTLC